MTPSNLGLGVYMYVHCTFEVQHVVSLIELQVLHSLDLVLQGTTTLYSRSVGHTYRLVGTL
jgi:hypothetical protein